MPGQNAIKDGSEIVRELGAKKLRELTGRNMAEVHAASLSFTSETCLHRTGQVPDLLVL